MLCALWKDVTSYAKNIFVFFLCATNIQKRKHVQYDLMDKKKGKKREEDEKNTQKETLNRKSFFLRSGSDTHTKHI